MGDLSKHFSRSEFECQCGCGFNTVDFQLVVLLEKIRMRFGAPVTINDTNGSGCRCRTHNALVGGGRNSQHLIGRAADIQVKGVPHKDVQDWLDTFHTGGMGRYSWGTHIDTRDKSARWSG